jgi:hypothetical protein
MRSIICLAVAMLLTAGVSACSYEEHNDTARAGYYNSDYGYYPERHYYSRGDYYRHYNGIDG